MRNQLREIVRQTAPGLLFHIPNAAPIPFIPVTSRAGRVWPRGLPAAAGLFLLALGPQALAQTALLKDAPVPGWPRLQIQTHYVARIAMRGNCFPVPAGSPIPETSFNSCARPDFWRGVCDIFIDIRHVSSAALHEHEVKRCRGHDFRNSNQFAEALRAWREWGENRFANMLDFRVMMMIGDTASECVAGSEYCIELP